MWCYWLFEMFLIELFLDLMLIFIIGFGLVVILLIGFFLFYQEVGIFKNLKFFVIWKNNFFFIFVLFCFIIGLVLGLVGYWGILELKFGVVDL